MKTTKHYLFISLLMLALVSCNRRAPIINQERIYTDFDSLFPVRQDGKWGFINSSGILIIEYRFDEEPIHYSQKKNKYLIVHSAGQQEMISADGKAIIDGYERIENINDNFYVAVKNKKSYVYLLQNNKPVMLTGPVDSVYAWDEYYATIYKSGQKFGFLLPEGKVISATAIIEKEALEKRIEFRPDTSFGDWQNGMCSFYVFSKSSGGFLKKNNETVPGSYAHTTDFSEGLAAVSDGRDWFYIDTTGKKIIPGPFQDAKSFYNGKAVVDRNKFIDKSGKIVATSKFPIISDAPKEGLYEVDAGKNTLPYGKGLIDDMGRLVIAPMDYDAFNSPSEGMITVGRKKEGSNLIDGYWGAIDLKGIEVIPMKYDNMRSFKEGYAPVFLRGHWGMVDKTGKLLIPIEYDHISDFHSGLARAEKNGKIFYFDKSGKSVWQEK